MLDYLVEQDEQAINLFPMTKAKMAQWLPSQPVFIQNWLESTGFTGDAGQVCLLPSEQGQVTGVAVGLSDEDPWAYASLPNRLPNATYRIAADLDGPEADWAALGWMLATHSFTRYKTRPERDWPRLVWPEAAFREQVERLYEATILVRSLINTPANDLGPAELAGEADMLALRFGAQIRVITGDALLTENYPCIHAVGRAAAAHRQPRLIDMTWGDAADPLVTLVGKGVCFDSGGLDIKGSANMKLMKKDMGGAAHVLGLALMIMAAELPVRLRVLIPAVENSVSGDSMRPLDVLPTRKGIRVEVGNTDAEGRLILADALFEASRQKPALLIDFATLTGAARTALGPDLPALFCNDDELAADLLRLGEETADSLWRLPLHKPYRRMLDSKIADLNSVSDGPYAGAITAALFLQEFVAPSLPWIHLDILGWNPSARPGRPDGGEAMGLRAIYGLIEQRFG